MTKIDYIITACNKSDVIKIGLDMLCKQTMKDILSVTLVNDCSTNTDCNYEDLIDGYKDKLDIKVLSTPLTIGDGMAKQYGIDNTSNPYIIFQDDADRLSDEFVIERIFNTIEQSDKNIKSIVSGWLRVDNNGNVLSKQRGEDIYTWRSRVLFRDILDKYNIRFDKAVSLVYSDIEFGNRYMYTILNNGYKELSVDGYYYIYNIGAEHSIFNMLPKDRIGIYAVIAEFKKYIFLKQKCIDDVDLYDILNRAFEKAFFALCMVGKKKEVHTMELYILRELVSECINDIGDSYIIHEDSDIYGVSIPSLFNDSESFYDCFMANPIGFINKIISAVR